MNTVPPTADSPGAMAPGPIEEMDTAVMAAAAEREPVLARDAARYMLLTNVVDGENVGIEIRHVEPSDSGETVLIVLKGGQTRWFRLDEPLDVVDKADAEAADGRLEAKRRRARQVVILRQLADLAETADMALPFFMRIEGSLGSLADLQAAAELLGDELTEERPGTWELTHTFGDGDGKRRYAAPVELALVHYERTKQ